MGKSDKDKKESRQKFVADYVSSRKEVMEYCSKRH